jgi:hypothetical protein
MMEFVAANWLWIVVIVAVVAMHRGGGCGGHSNHRTRNNAADDRATGANTFGEGSHR